MNVIMGRLIKVLTHKKEGILVILATITFS